MLVPADRTECCWYTAGLSPSIAEHGFALATVVTPTECESLRAAIGLIDGAGRRGLLANSAIAALACSPRLLHSIALHTGESPKPVRAIYFDKSPRANWFVGWHQDVMVAVAERVEASGFSSWSVKDGVPHVQPPAELLAQMLTVRIHLDDADETNGALRVLPGTHQRGRLSSEQLAEAIATIPEQVCRAAAGEALFMRPLLAHASSRSTSPRRRRVIHLEYAAFDLPGGLKWRDAA